MNAQSKSILLAGALVAAAAYSTSSRADYRPSAEDQRITNEVAGKIAADPRMPRDARIQVETRDGNVTLTGFVDLPDQVDSAGLDAESVAGVLDVDNIVRPRIGTAF